MARVVQILPMQLMAGWDRHDGSASQHFVDAAYPPLTAEITETATALTSPTVCYL